MSDRVFRQALNADVEFCFNEELVQIDDTDKVELVSYSVAAKWGEIDNQGLFIPKEDTGFTHNIPKYGKNTYYLISGVVKNIAVEKLSSISIIANFYDTSKNFLRAEIENISDIDNSFSETFKIYYYCEEKYFDNVDSVNFEFEVS